MTEHSRERRRAPRVEEQLPLTIAVRKEALLAMTRNLSSSGVYCDVDHDVPLMTKVALTIALPACAADAAGRPARHIRCRGVVVRSEAITNSSATEAPHHLAIVFTQVQARDRQAIALFVAERLTAQRAWPSARQTRHAAIAPPPSCANPRDWRGGWLLGLLVILSAAEGCQAHLVIARGPHTKALVDALGTSAQDKYAYTFRWLQRRCVDVNAQLRFDGLIVDLQGRNIQPLRDQDGNHVLLLSTRRLARSHAPSQKQELTIPAKDLPTLQAVVRRYHFEPQLITDAGGSPQAVVYVPVPTRLSVRQTADGAVRVEIERVTGGIPVGSVF